MSGARDLIAIATLIFGGFVLAMIAMPTSFPVRFLGIPFGVAIAVAVIVLNLVLVVVFMRRADAGDGA
jgi:hypothetical protein